MYFDQPRHASHANHQNQPVVIWRLATLLKGAGQFFQYSKSILNNFAPLTEMKDEKLVLLGFNQLLDIYQHLGGAPKYW